MSVNILEEDGLKRIAGNPDPAITVDSELSRTSENPVQNKVVTAALQEKANNSELDKGVAGSYAAGVAEEIFGINADLAQIKKNSNYYFVSGEIARAGGDGTLRGYGSATITLLGQKVSGTVARIDVSFKISGGTDDSSNPFNWGVSREIIKEKTGLDIFPKTGGYAVMYSVNASTSAVTMQEILIGYGYTFQIPGSLQYWTLARVYTTAGNVGSWAAHGMLNGAVIQGVCYGTLV